MVSKALRATIKPRASFSLLLNQAFWNIREGRAVWDYPVQSPHSTLEDIRVETGKMTGPKITQLISGKKPGHHKKPGLWTPCSALFRLPAAFQEALNKPLQSSIRPQAFRERKEGRVCAAHIQTSDTQALTTPCRHPSLAPNSYNYENLQLWENG